VVFFDDDIAAADGATVSSIDAGSGCGYDSCPHNEAKRRYKVVRVEQRSEV
jgi:hypothetical protein